MKKTSYLFIVALVMTLSGLSQVSNFTVTPQTQCYNSNGNVGYAGISSWVPSATLYTWVISSPTTNCNASYSSTVPNGSLISITYPCCGIYTITCFAYNTTTNPSTLITTLIHTTTISCSSSSLSVSGNTTICSGNSTVLHVSGANSYTWQPGNISGDSIVVSPSVTTCYTVTGTSSISCVNPKVVCVIVQPSASLSVSGPSTICSGNYTYLYANGATNYTWLPSGNTNSYIAVSPSVSTCYTLLGNSCSGITSTLKCLTVIANPTLSVSGNTNICAGQSTTLSLSGANSYTWYSGGGSGGSIVLTPSATTCYSAYGQSTNGCYGYIGVCVNVGNSGTVSVNGPGFICNGSYATLVAGGMNTYTWQPGSLTGSVVVVSPSVNTCYTVIGTSSGGCIGYAVKCVSVQINSSVSISGSSSVCAGTSNVMQASGGTSYTWYPGGSTNAYIIPTASVNTCYTLIGQTCGGISTAIHCVSVFQNPTVTVSGNVTVCPGMATTLTASGANSYTWMNGSATYTGSSIVITPTASSCYSVLGVNSFTNGNYCGSYNSVCVSVQNTSVGITGPTSLCSGNSTTLSAFGALNYTWYPGGMTGANIVVTPTTSMCYTVFGSSGSGCSGYAVKCLSVQSSPNVSITPWNGAICSGSYNLLYASGASNYTWLPSGSNSPSIVVTPSANTCYTLMGSGCSGLSYAVYCQSVIPSPTLIVVGNNTICSGGTTSFTASGANTYNWYTSSGTYTGSSYTYSSTASNCFSLTGFNSFGCPTTTGVCVTVQGGSLSVSGPTSICAGNNTTLTASGALNYTWFPGNMTGSSIVVSPSVSTCYTVYGYNITGCSGVGVKCITVSQTPTITTSLTNGQLCTGSAYLTASGANTYTWLPFNLVGSGVTFTVGSPMCFTVNGMSSSGCIGSVVNCFSVSPSPTLTVNGGNINCSGLNTTLTATGAQSYMWYPGGMSGSSIVVSPSVSTCYTLQGISNGCTSYAVKCLSVQSGPSISVAGGNTVCAGSSATVFANGAQSYTWLPGNITGPVVTLTPSVSTCYTIVGTGSNGCVGLGSLCMQVVPKPNVVTSGGIYCAGSTTTLTASGANSYVWQPGNLTGSTIVVAAGANTCYTVNGTNFYGCSNSAIACLSVIATPDITVGGIGTVCAGQGATLIVTGANSYTWLPGGLTGNGVVVTPSVSTCYTVLGYNNSNGCLSSAVKCISVNQNPSINISGNSILCSGSSANLLVSGASSYTWNTGSNSPFITVSPTLNSCYTAYGTNASGCIGTAVKCISVQAAPVLNLGGPNYICQGMNATFFASGAISYSWNTGSTNSVISVAPNTSTVYTVTGSNGICSSVKSITLNVAPLPNIWISVNDTIICGGSVSTLTALGANSYTWNTGSTLSSIAVSPSITTTYTASGTSTNGCSNSAAVTINVLPCTSISKQVNELDVNFYPNPVSDILHLQSETNQSTRYQLFDLLGKEIATGKFENTISINVTSYANGTYILKMETNGQIQFKKIVVAK